MMRRLNNVASKPTLGVSLNSLIGANAIVFLISQEERKQAEIKAMEEHKKVEADLSNLKRL